MKVLKNTLEQGIAMGECNTKTIQINFNIFRHNHTYPGIIHPYSGIFRTLCYPDLFKTVVFKILCRTQTYSDPELYSEPQHIHNYGIFRTPLYSERWNIQNLRHIQDPVVHLR